MAFDIFPKETQEYLLDQILNTEWTKGYVSLFEFHHMAVFEIPENDRLLNEVFGHTDTVEARELTLRYMHEMLEKGEIKIGEFGLLAPGEQPIPKDKLPGHPMVRGFEGTPEEIIGWLRTQWNSEHPQSKFKDMELITFEDTIVITTADRDWPTY